ncbi:MAG: UPF0182 family protein [Methylocystis sp.]|uniref:UPF0182 family protein n=1 Tax=Methylocystis sp. TaxID=1911079 RepID=UPI003DA569D9
MGYNSRPGFRRAHGKAEAAVTKRLTSTSCLIRKGQLYRGKNIQFFPVIKARGGGRDEIWGNRIALAMLLIAACLALSPALSVLIDWLWFSALGYPSVFWTMLKTKLAVFCAAFAASTILLWLNGSLAVTSDQVVPQSLADAGHTPHPNEALHAENQRQGRALHSDDAA